MGSIHDGHRDRIRRRVENESLDYFEPHEILELLLFYVERQGDTNATAHELIEKFGSLSEVLDADRSKLEEVKGIGKNASFFLHLIPQICRRYMMSKSDNSAAKIINNSELAHEILAPYFIGRTVETLYMLCLNNHGEQIACEYISEGTVNATSINMKKIVSIVIKTNASAVILCHNHPGGVAIPSKQDILLTKNLAAVLDSIGVILLDHLIVVDGDFVSFFDSSKNEIVVNNPADKPEGFIDFGTI